ncbi:glycosyltransferase [Microbacterium oryzae]|uniref:glycosyltransferase n=1 Tax=Microbacterium oryzae TaxID=743009 RepID=UPI0025B0244C|nr:glycosyltransferase [Microbacterium oryzae]MDN3309413.1 glycosyltransferase [Microbacterium oryzae]
MTLRVLSLYEGFFAGGARVLHTDVVAGLHDGVSQTHTVLSLSSRARREGTEQHLDEDARHRRLARAGVETVALSGTAGSDPFDPASFTELDLRRAADAIAAADVVLSLKEQPLGLLLALRDHGLLPAVPVAACLHRSDPEHSGPALGWLTDAGRAGILGATIACAVSTDDAYARHLPVSVERHIVANGVDVARFTPGGLEETDHTRRHLGIPLDAPIVLLAARFDPMKDPRLFLQAAALHSAVRSDTHFVMCGAGMTKENPAFAALLADAGVDPARVHALGIRDDMPAIHRLADIVALTSAFGEASPLCLLEGAASGATPVTTDVGDSAREVAGFGVVTTRSAQDIAAAWGAVLEDRASLRHAALAARPALSRERMLTEYRGVIERLARRESIAA